MEDSEWHMFKPRHWKTILGGIGYIVAENKITMGKSCTIYFTISRMVDSPERTPPFRDAPPLMTISPIDNAETLEKAKEIVFDDFKSFSGSYKRSLKRLQASKSL